jgi:hypothetical protein
MCYFCPEYYQDITNLPRNGGCQKVLLQTGLILCTTYCLPTYHLRYIPKQVLVKKKLLTKKCVILCPEYDQDTLLREMTDAKSTLTNWFNFCVLLT